MNSIYRKENLRILRRYLGLTQKEFIAHFLCDNEKPMSIASFSNLEAKGGARLNEVILKTSGKISVDSNDLCHGFSGICRTTQFAFAE